VQFSPNNKFTASLKNTLYVPDLRINLLSVSKICDHGFNIVFKKDKAEIIRATRGDIVFTAPRKLDLYHIEEKHECSQIAAGKQNSKTTEWPSL